MLGVYICSSLEHFSLAPKTDIRTSQNFTLLRNLYAGQEATVTAEHGTTHWFQIGKGVRQAVYCHPAYLTFMQSTS